MVNCRLCGDTEHVVIRAEINVCRECLMQTTAMRWLWLSTVPLCENHIQHLIQHDVVAFADDEMVFIYDLYDDDAHVVWSPFS